MMYMTRFPINRTRRETMRVLASPYKMHAAIAGSFSPNEDTGRVLWRIDALDRNYLVLYIVSSSKPSLIGLDEQIGWPDMEHQWQTRDYKPFLSSIKKDRRYSFRLVANPVVSRKSIETMDGRGKRIGHLTSVQQQAWLIGKEAYAAEDIATPQLFADAPQSRAEKNGFSVVCDPLSGIPKLTVSERQKLSFTRGNTGESITLVRARYDGILEVEDAEAVRAALVNGIGHAKGFGCGMLTLAPLDRS